MRRPIPTPHSGGLMLSYRCTAECLHCMYGCSPRWSADWITEEHLAAILGQLAPFIEAAPGGPTAMGLSEGLHFSGGEPFLNFELLCRAAELASDLRIPSTFVETNCYWAADDDTTRAKLVALKKRALAGILISVNPFYLEYVPFEHTERCIRISHEVFGSNVAVYQWDYYRRFKALGITGRMPLEEYVKLEPGTTLFQNVEFFISGRAAYALASRLGGSLARCFRRHPASFLATLPCAPPFVRSWHNHFDNYGNYMPGFCGGLSYGDCRDLEGLVRDGIDDETVPVLALLMDGRFSDLVQLAADHGYTEAPEGYFSKCHLCVDLRKHLAAANGFKELAPREFYDHLS